MTTNDAWQENGGRIWPTWRYGSHDEVFESAASIVFDQAENRMLLSKR